MPAVLTADHFLPPVQPGEMLDGPGQCSGLGIVHGLNYGVYQQTLKEHALGEQYFVAYAVVFARRPTSQLPVRDLD